MGPFLVQLLLLIKALQLRRQDLHQCLHQLAAALLQHRLSQRRQAGQHSSIAVCCVLPSCTVSLLALICHIFLPSILLLLRLVLVSFCVVLVILILPNAVRLPKQCASSIPCCCGCSSGIPALQPSLPQQPVQLLRG